MNLASGWDAPSRPFMVQRWTPSKVTTGPANVRELRNIRHDCSVLQFRPECLENYPKFFIVDERKHMRAALAEPIMPYAVDSSRRITRRITSRSVMAFGSKTEELAATSPMKRSRTCWVCTLRMKTPIEWRPFHRFLV